MAGDLPYVRLCCTFSVPDKKGNGKSPVPVWIADPAVGLVDIDGTPDNLQPVLTEEADRFRETLVFLLKDPFCQ
jgi:hypothetical protein